MVRFGIPFLTICAVCSVGSLCSVTFAQERRPVHKAAQASKEVKEESILSYSIKIVDAASAFFKGLAAPSTCDLEDNLETPGAKLPASVTVCVHNGYSAAPCKNQTLSCDFSGDQAKRRYFRENGGVPKPTTIFGTDYAAVSQNYFGSTRQGFDRVESDGFATCQGMVLMNPACGQANLMHRSGVDPHRAPLTLFKDLNADPDCNKTKEQTRAFFLLSNYTDYDQRLEDYEYRRMLCETAALIPGAPITVLYSKKTKEDGDGLDLRRTGTGFTLKAERNHYDHGPSLHFVFDQGKSPSVTFVPAQEI